jgi:hypothetical protein
MGGSSGRSSAWAEVVAHDARFEFPDVIGFADGGTRGDRWRGGPWAAERRMHRVAFLSKPNGAHRRLAVLDPTVHARYRMAVAQVAGPVERALGHEVTGSRCVATGRRLALEPWRRARRRHVRRVASWRCGVVRLDVRNCFASMSFEVVEEALARTRVARPAGQAVLDLLRAFEADGIAGLPVGPEPSAVLANAVLASADRSLRMLGLRFVRWSDDVTVAVAGGDPRAVAEAWTAALAPLGLRPAHEKTRFEDTASLRDRPSGPIGPRRAAFAGVGGRGAEGGHGARAARTDLCELAVVAMHGPDPHRARAAVARLGRGGGRDARAVLRDVRARFPYLAATADWGLHR